MTTTLTRAEELLAAYRSQGEAERLADHSSYRYDIRGDLVEIIEADGTRVSFEYDERRRLTRAGDACYRYNDQDRLCEIQQEGVLASFEHDDLGRVTCARQGNAGAVVYRYDERGRTILGRTATVSTAQDFDDVGRITAIRQTRNGVTIEAGLAYDVRGRLSRLSLAGCDVRYEWDEQGAPARVDIGEQAWVQFTATGLQFSNGVREEIGSCREVSRDGEVLHRREYHYGAQGLLENDGTRRYSYDSLGQLERVEEAGRSIPLSEASQADSLSYRYNDARQLIEARCCGDPVASFEYDHKGRLALAGNDRFLYGPMDELLAVTDELGRPRRLYVHTPIGCIAEVRDGQVYFRHNDERGTCNLITDENGEVAARFRYQPFGAPKAYAGGFQPVFGGHIWHNSVRLYYCGARWYDPVRRRFLTADTYTARPDDARLVNPAIAGSDQPRLRAHYWSEWARHPRARDPYCYCANDPVNRIDPTGHWSFGGVLLMLLGVVWSMPNTLLALLIEITCILIEPIRTLVSAIAGHARFTVGFDAAASGRLSTFAIVFRGGWFGSFDSILAFTFGNIFFLNQDWESNLVITQGGDVQPAAYNGTVTMTRKQALYEHMLRHANHCSWLGPFFHLGAPLFGFYWWFRFLGGGAYSWFERDAREHGGI
jgi:YD repeat-containing protein